jgi:hypothetical protein
MPTSALRLFGKPALSRIVPVKFLEMGRSMPPEIAGLIDKPRSYRNIAPPPIKGEIIVCPAS